MWACPPSRKSCMLWRRGQEHSGPAAVSVGSHRNEGQRYFMKIHAGICTCPECRRCNATVVHYATPQRALGSRLGGQDSTL